jgi:hypothetical protein
MWEVSGDIQNGASEYALQRGLVLQCQLGHGADGIIFSTSAASAIKAFRRREGYQRELMCYHRLMERQVLQVRGHRVPQLVAFDDRLLIVEMTIVQPPFLLDFASAYLDSAPDFTAEIVEQWYQEKAEQFGEHWSDVLIVLDELRRGFGIHLLDINPGNITFRERT